MPANLIKALVLTAVFAAAAPAFADEWKATVASSDVTDPASEHFLNFTGGTLRRSCDLMGPDAGNPDGVAISGDISVSKADLRLLANFLPENMRTKSFEEQTAYFDALPPAEHERIREGFKAYVLNLLPGIKQSFESAFIPAARDADTSGQHEDLTRAMKTLADKVRQDTGASVSIELKITDSCAKAPAPQN
jgi:hypothetical protein